jgi:hypothetical protein
MWYREGWNIPLLVASWKKTVISSNSRHSRTDLHNTAHNTIHVSLLGNVYVHSPADNIFLHSRVHSNNEARPKKPKLLAQISYPNQSATAIVTVPGPWRRGRSARGVPSTVPDKSLELLLTYTSYNGQNLNSPSVSVIRGSTVQSYLQKKRRSPKENMENKQWKYPAVDYDDVHKAIFRNVVKNSPYFTASHPRRLEPSSATLRGLESVGRFAFSLQLWVSLKAKLDATRHV